MVHTRACAVPMVSTRKNTLKLNYQWYRHRLAWYCINSSPLVPHMRRWIGSALVQIMACCLFGAKPLSKSILLLSIGTLETNFSEIFIKIQNFSFTKMHLKISSAKWWPFCPGGDELRLSMPCHVLQWITVCYGRDIIFPCATILVTLSCPRTGHHGEANI